MLGSAILSAGRAAPQSAGLSMNDSDTAACDPSSITRQPVERAKAVIVGGNPSAATRPPWSRHSSLQRIAQRIAVRRATEFFSRDSQLGIPLR